MTKVQEKEGDVLDVNEQSDPLVPLPPTLGVLPQQRRCTQQAHRSKDDEQAEVGRQQNRAYLGLEREGEGCAEEEEEDGEERDRAEGGEEGGLDRLRKLRMNVSSAFCLFFALRKHQPEMLERKGERTDLESLTRLFNLF